MRLQDKVIVVTGSSKGIGLGVAKRLGAEGAKIVLAGRREQDRDELENMFAQAGMDAMFVRTDVSSVKDCYAMIDRTVERFGKIDGLVNNAGIFPHIKLMQTDEAVFDSVMATNAKGAFFCTQRALHYMKKSMSGAIVNIGSTHWAMGAETLPVYSMSKGALHTLTQHVAHHYAPYRIRCNWVTVGWVLSPGEIKRHLAEGHDQGWIDSLAKQYIPSGEFQTNDDIAWACVYLLADESAQVTGTDIHVTGGFKPERILPEMEEE